MRYGWCVSHAPRLPMLLMLLCCQLGSSQADTEQFFSLIRAQNWFACLSGVLVTSLEIAFFRRITCPDQSSCCTLTAGISCDPSLNLLKYVSASPQSFFFLGFSHKYFARHAGGSREIFNRHNSTALARGNLGTFVKCAFVHFVPPVQMSFFAIFQ